MKLYFSWNIKAIYLQQTTDASLKTSFFFDCYVISIIVDIIAFRTLEKTDKSDNGEIFSNGLLLSFNG